MRIITGELKGMRLQGPGRTNKFRPTEDRVREALFSILGSPAQQASFLDLYAGSGAIGIEAASRGYERVWLVESQRFSLGVLRANLRTALERLDGVELRSLASPVERFLKRGGVSPFDVIYCDPPYQLVSSDFVTSLAAMAPITKEGLLIIEHPFKAKMPEMAPPFTLERTARYGNCSLSFYVEGSETQ